MSTRKPAPFPTIVHPFKSPTPRSCAYESGSPSSRNALVFIGGLGDGPHTVRYVRTIAAQLEAAGGLSYSVFELRMSSSFAGFGHTRLESDVADLSALVTYLRGLGRERIVFFGHSTGCQDCLEYTDYAKHKSEPVDGFILQAPVSDREAALLVMSEKELGETLTMASDMIEAGKQDEVMPREKVSAVVRTPITAYRWHSLAAPGGDDDFFSTDLPDEKLAAFWSKFQKPVLLLPSGEDEHVPKTVDARKNIERWTRHCGPGIVSPLSGLIPGANHTVDRTDAQAWMADRVIGFLRALETERSSL